MPCVGIDVSQYWLKLWFAAWCHQAITWNNIDLSLKVFCGIHLRAISLEGPMHLFCNMRFWNCYHISLRPMTLLARFMGPTWGPSGAGRTQVGPMLAPWTLLSWELILRPESICCIGWHSWLVGSLSWQYDQTLFIQLSWIIDLMYIGYKVYNVIIPVHIGRSPRRRFPHHALMPHCTFFPHLLAQQGVRRAPEGKGALAGGI